MSLETHLELLAIEECAKATLEQGIDGAYISNLDELFEFAACLKRRWEKEKAEQNLPVKK